MAKSEKGTVDRSYGCTFACGNQYDYVLTDVHESNTLFLCTPCFIHLSAEMVGVITGDGSETLSIPAAATPPSGHNVPNIITGDLFADDDS